MIRQSSLIFAIMLLSGCGQSDKNASEGAVAAGADKTSALVAAATPPPAFAVCSSCHAVASDRQGVGPHLVGVVGRTAGALPDYAYSDALKSSGIVWNAATLDTWLAAPIKMVPGTKMVIGVPDAEGRKAVIEYLKTLK